MMYLVLFIYAIIFIELFILLKIIPDAQGVLALSSKSIEVMKSNEMSDREKEAFMRTNSLTMMKATFKFIGKFLLIIVALVVANYIVELISAELAAQVMASFTSLRVIIIVTVVAMIYVWIRNVISKKL